MDDDFETTKKVGQLGMLSLTNFHTWKDKFIECCYSFGAAGRILLHDKDIVLTEPQRDEVIIMRKVHSGPKKKGEKDVVEHVLKYPDTEAGLKAFTNDTDKYNNLIDKKMKLMGFLLRHLEQPVKDKLAMHKAVYETAKANSDVLTVWKLIVNVLRGTGTVSVSAETLRLVRAKQGEDSFAAYVKNFYEIVTNLRKLRDDGIDVLEVLMNTLFVLGLDPEEFKDILDRDVLPKSEWPAFEDLSTTLTQYSENKERIVSINNGEVDDQAISANVAKSGSLNRRSGGKESGTFSRYPIECWNCEDNHNRAYCPERPHRCEICGELGHTQKHHSNPRRIDHDATYGYNGSNNNSEKAPVTKKSVSFSRSSPVAKAGVGGATRPVMNGAKQKKVTAKSAQRQKVISEAAIANLSALGEQIAAALEDITGGGRVNDESWPDDTYDEEEGEYDDGDEADGAIGYVARIVDEENKSFSDVVESMLKTDVAHDDKLFLDSGANKAHVVSSPALLHKLLASSRAEVKGISGHSLKPSAEGELIGLPGRALCVPEAQANLVSLSHLLEHIDGRFEGDRKYFRVYNGEDVLVLVAVNNGNGLYELKLSDLKNEAEMMRASAYLEQSVVVDNAVKGEAVVQLSAEERARAKDARDLCALLGHPGKQALIKGLDNNAYGFCHLTGRDFVNGIRLYGECQACLEGKMKAPSNPTSLSPPATEIGEHLHGDIIPLSGTSIGGNNFVLVIVDEKSGLGVGVAIKSKSASVLRVAFRSVIAFFSQYGWRVRKITTDDERTLAACRDYVREFGVAMGATPAGHHEKRAERYIQTLRSRLRAMLAHLPYVLPQRLEGESIMAAIYYMNRVPNSASGLVTPHQLVTRERPSIPRYYFGQVGLAYKPSKDGDRGVPCLFLSYGESSTRYLRCFVPHYNNVYSTSKFHPTPTHIPVEWKLMPRIATPSAANIVPLPPVNVATAGGNVHIQSGVPLVPHSMQKLTPRLGSDPFAEEVCHDVVGAVDSSTTPSVTCDDQEGGVVVAQSKDVDGAETKVVDEEGGVIKLAEESMKMADKESDSRLLSHEKLLSHAKKVADKEGVGDKQLVDQEGGSVDNKKHLPALRSSLPRSSKSSDWKYGPAKYKLTKKEEQRIQVHIARVTSDPHGPLKVMALQMSIKRALRDRQRRAAILKAIEDEIRNMENHKVMNPILYEQIPKEYRDGIISVFAFLKDKYKSNGDFDKSKCRFVAKGDDADMTKIRETFAPTVNPISVMTQLNLAAVEAETKISSYDVKGAFLITPITNGQRIFVRISADIVTHWVRLSPHIQEFVQPNGCMYCELNKYMYGLCESPHEFNSLLDKSLQNIGLIPSRADKCLYTLKTEMGRIIVSVHVDDMLVTTTNQALREWFEKEMKSHFDLVCQYDSISFLGMSISRCHDEQAGKNDIKISQDGFVRDILVRYGCEHVAKPPKTPATADLFERDETSPLCDQKEFLSLVMTLMYLARYTRPDILLAVTALAAQSSKPTEQDWSRLLRVVRYLSGTSTVGIRFKSEAKICPQIFADASHATHQDGKGHGGIILTLGSGPVHCRSFKLKATTRSSTESELFALEEASTYVIWWSSLLEDLGVAGRAGRPMKVYQDNQSTIILAAQGGSFKRTKHMLVKESFVRERISDGDLVLKYLPTGDMIADMLTKPLAVHALRKFMALLHVC